MLLLPYLVLLLVAAFDEYTKKSANTDVDAQTAICTALSFCCSLVVTFDGYTKNLSILVLMLKLPNNSLVIMGVATFGDGT